MPQALPIHRCFGSIVSIIALFAVILIVSMFAGCATGTSDRGSTGDTRGGTVIQKGIFFGGTGYAPNQTIDDQSFDIVADALDQQIASLDAALNEASKANDAELVKDITAKIAALKQAKQEAIKANLIYVDNGDTTVTTSGTASASSPGDTTQTPSTQTSPQTSLEFPLAP